MAQNEVIVRYRVEEDGSLKQIEKEAGKAAGATERLTNTTERYNRSQRAAAGFTNNGTREFAKLRSGTTGLVGAYAVLASNVFAASAAFNAFRRAAQVEQLEKGLIAVGAAAGNNLPAVAKGLRDITGEALSSEQAMRATALASASGFRTDQLNDLAKVAKGASLALGRDMGDAFDRLVRGTAKVEPEILDELGIFVRLDDAVRDYADRLQVAESSLTQYDRSQAFLNATLEDGLKKYEDLSERIDPNEYDQLAASLADLQKNFLGAINGFFGFGDAVKFASNNLLSLTVVGTTLASTVTSQVAPGLLTMAETSAENADNMLGMRAEMARTITQGKKMPKVFNSVIDSIQDGTATAEDFDKANASLTGRLGAQQREINKVANQISQAGVPTQELTNRFADLTAQQEETRGQMTRLNDLQSLQNQSQIASSRSASLQFAAQGNLIGAFRELGDAQRVQREENDKANKTGSKAGKAFRTIKTGAMGAAGGVKILGTAFLTFLPYIGLLISAGAILYGFIKDKFFPEDIVKKRIDEAIESFEFFSEITENFASSDSVGGQRLAESYIALAGIFDSVRAEIVGVNEAATKKVAEQIRDEEKRIAELEKRIAGIQARQTPPEEVQNDASLGSIMSNIGYTMSTGGGTRDAAASFAANTSELVSAAEELDEITTNKTDLITAREEKRRKGIVAVNRAALESLRIQRMIADDAGDLNPFNLAITERMTNTLKDLTDKLEDGVITADEFERQYAKMQRQVNNTRAAFQGIDEAVNKVNTNISKRRVAADSLFQDDINDANALLELFKSTKKASEERVTILPELTDQQRAETLKAIEEGTYVPPTAEIVPTEAALEAQQLLEELRKRIEGLNIPEKFGKGEGAVQAFVDELVRLRGNINKATVDLKAQQQAVKEIKSAVKGIAGGVGIMMKAEQSLLRNQIALIDNRVEAEALAANMTEEAYLKTKDGIKLAEERARLAEQQVKDTYIQLKNEQSLLANAKERNKLAAQRLENDLRIMKLNAQASGGRITPKEQYNLDKLRAETTLKAAEQELEFLISSAELRAKILEAELKAAGVEEAVVNDILAALKTQLDIQKDITREKIRGARIGLIEAGADSGPEAPRASGIVGAVQEGGESVAAAQARSDYLSAQAAEVKKEGDILRSTSPLLMSEEAKARLAEIESLEQAAVRAYQNIFNAQVQAIRGTMAVLNEGLAELGPEVEYAASFGAMADQMLADSMIIKQAIENMNTEGITSFGDFVEAIKAGGQESSSALQTLAAGLAMVANSIGSLAATAAAGFRNTIEGIDQAIEAEKRLDGKSKASQQKMQALEAKKEKVKRKAFETDKKLKLAQAVMATAAGVAQALSMANLFPFNVVLAGMIAAMGAAQISIISGMTYNGGGQAPQAPSKVSVGNRQNTVDLARASSPSGELAYARGASGTGQGMTNYKPTPSFTGTKYRAAGGNTAFMVGEQGPEMFVPDRPGTIVPADETETAMGAPLNVNFTVNAMDTVSLEEMLLTQRGYIIGMIREAANSSGETFIESVNVMSDQYGGP